MEIFISEQCIVHIMVPTELSNDGRGVSPVVGIALLIAITVILAAAVGTFVLSQGVQEPAPDVGFTVSEERDSGLITSVTFVHDGIETVDGDQLRVVYTGEAGFDDTIQGNEQYGAGDEFTVEFNDNEDPGELRIVWDADGGDQGEILHEHRITDETTD